MDDLHGLGWVHIDSFFLIRPLSIKQQGRKKSKKQEGEREINPFRPK
jgi:hypothetical protein